MSNDELEKIAKQLDSLDTSELVAIIKRGELLERARRGCSHGEWLDWLKHRLKTSPSSAARYRKASKFAKLANLDVASCKLTAETLFLLSGNAYWKQRKLGENARREATESVLKAATKQKIGRKAALAIISASLGPEVIAQPKTVDVPLAPASPSEKLPPMPAPGSLRYKFRLWMDEGISFFETPQRQAYHSVPGTRIERSSATTPAQIAERAQLLANVWSVSGVKSLIEYLTQMNEASMASAGEDFPS